MNGKPSEAMSLTDDRSNVIWNQRNEKRTAIILNLANMESHSKC